MQNRIRGIRAALAILTMMPLGYLRAEGPLSLPPLIEQAEQQRVEAVSRAMKSTVCVFVPGGGGGGSGVLISPDGYALTNFHVTSPAGSAMRCGLSDGNLYDAVIVGIDPVGDLAMIRLLGLDGKPRNDFPFAAISDHRQKNQRQKNQPAKNSRQAVAGDWCMVIGNPFLLATNLQPTVTWGILSGVGRYQYPSGTLLEYGDSLQTDASVNPGNSGGPIYDADGKLLGIVGRCSFEKRGRVNVGVGYAISMGQALNFLGNLRSGRIVDHATLGATVTTDPDGGGVRVTNLLEFSDAYRRGLRYDSQILSLDGRIVQTANDLQNVLATLPSQWRVKLRYRENEKTIDTLVRLRSVHGQDELLEKMAGALPPPPPRKPEKPKEHEEGEPEEEEGAEDAADKIPASVRKQLIQRKGYANYFFNLQEQTKFIDSLRHQFPGKTDAKLSAWSIQGSTDADPPVPVHLHLGSEKITMTVGQRPMDAKNRSELYDAITDRSLGGIVSALDAWRRMLADGPKRFGDSYYLGTQPLGGQRPLRDCMVGIDGEIEVRWLTHPESGAVEVIEAFADRDEDPAELWIIRKQGAPDAMPQALDLRYGTDSVFRINLKTWERVEDKS